MSKWREVRLGEIANINMGQSPKSVYYNNSNKGVKFLQGNRTFGRIYPYFDTYTTKITKMASKGDILFTVRAPVGSINIANDDICIGRGIAGIRGLENNSFLFYNLIFNNELLKTAENGTTYGSVNKSDLENFKIKIPDLETQEKIAQVLSSYDELIENNNRRIELLEKMAEEIYKEWFVRMRFPGHEEVRFEKGIPEGWEVKKIGDISDIKYGKNLPTDKLLKSGYEVFGGNGVIGYYEEYIYKEPKILISCRGAASGKIVISNEYSFVTNNSLVLDSISSRYFEYFKMYFMNQDLTPYVTGSAQPQITITNIGKMKVIIPDEKLIDELNAKLIYISSNITLLNKQNQNLIKQRDMLLPRLMNGTIEVE